jgi:hypothetical protein
LAHLCHPAVLGLSFHSYSSYAVIAMRRARRVDPRSFDLTTPCSLYGYRIPPYEILRTGSLIRCVLFGCPSEVARVRWGVKRLGTQRTAVTDDTITISERTRFQVAMIIAIIADALQIFLMPFLVEGATSPADDILDLGIGAALFSLLGWHWEFLPSFVAKLVPGVDLVPFWTMAVANVYRKSKRIAVSAEEIR